MFMLIFEWLVVINSIEFFLGFKFFLKFDWDFYVDIVEYIIDDGDCMYIDVVFGKESNDYVMVVLVIGFVVNVYYELGDQLVIV